MSDLIVAASRGNVAEVLRLLRAGASLSARDASGVGVMAVAIYDGHTPLVKCLIKEGFADINAIVTSTRAGVPYAI
jgi:ankyrin repeat protein